MKRTHVVIINGVGSVGKSSTARELQRLATSSFLYVAMDQFIEGLPKRLLGSPEGVVFVPGTEDGKPCTSILTGAAFKRAMSGMRRAVAALAGQGNDLVVDEVFWSGEEQEYRQLLRDYELHLVALTAPLEVIEERELNREDRYLGLARWQFSRVHRNVDYDLEIETSNLTPTEAAKLICEAYQL